MLAFDQRVDVVGFGRLCRAPWAVVEISVREIARVHPQSGERGVPRVRRGTQDRRAERQIDGQHRREEREREEVPSHGTSPLIRATARTAWPRRGAPDATGGRGRWCGR